MMGKFGNGFIPLNLVYTKKTENYYYLLRLSTIEWFYPVNRKVLVIK